MNTMGDSPSVPPSQCRATWLKGQLERAREAKLWAAGHRRSAPGYQPLFFPSDAIEEVLNREQVRSVLECPCEWCERLANYAPQLMGYESGATYVDFIMRRALRLFALLVHVGLPALIRRFVRTGDHILNEELDRERLKATYLSGIDSLTAVPAQALDGLLDAFLNGRHKFNPPVFDGGWLEQWDENKALPFINTEFVGEGGYGRVYSFQIYPGYGAPGLESPTRLAMKEVHLAGRSLNAEAVTLMRIREELGEERHIIKVLKIFLRGNMIHFIFPFATGNLSDFMQNPWTHDTTTPICQNTIWDQVVGIMKALAKFHRPSSISNWRGYHADIKPTNILVFHDGTLVITDFGQALIAQRRSSEMTRRIPQPPGEQTYRPAENSYETSLGPEYDDWAMGCVLLEILVFAINGSSGVDELYRARRREQYATDYYYQVVGDQRIFHPEVEGLLNRYMNTRDSPCDTVFTENVVSIVRSMLQIDSTMRINTATAVEKLQEELSYWRPRASEGSLASANPANLSPVHNSYLGLNINVDGSPLVAGSSSPGSAIGERAEFRDPNEGGSTRHMRADNRPSRNPELDYYALSSASTPALPDRVGDVSPRTRSLYEYRPPPKPRDSISSLPISFGIADERGMYEIPGEIEWSVSSGNLLHRGNVIIKGGGPRGSLRVEANDGARDYCEPLNVPASSLVIPDYAFRDRMETIQDYSIHVATVSLHLPAEDGVHALQEFLTEQRIHLSLRAKITLNKKKGFGEAITFRDTKIVWDDCMVQLWTEMGQPIASREVWGRQFNAPPSLMSRLIIYNVNGDTRSFISIPLVDGNNRLELKDEIDDNRITISRVAGASIWAYTFVGTDGASPGIPLRKEALLGQESREKPQKYVAIQLDFQGSSRDDFRKFKNCYSKQAKARGQESSSE